MRISKIKIFIFVLIFVKLIEVDAYYFDYIKVNEKQNVSVEFECDKIGNYTYKLHFIHYGNIKENMQINIYLNGNLVYKIGDSNDASPAHEKNVTVDITDYLKDGENVLRVEGISIKGNETYHPYYVLDEVYINEPIKSPISFRSVVLTLILTTFIILKMEILNKNK
ncbi:hypothetical protein [Methanotorris igneus]|uniref:Uncharacterized protein n=1 Tax=Methanotorris igneus (strain DSM 5666 / JCM 11834 / Kol 5) TaxID=880724 RepID=F6BA93_METIK|nr:hypothetical protein [Methanotorris igneus]AEF95783.1 hypothetical protein Metig_0226 [Methanotorris igneus Kol 5]